MDDASRALFSDLPSPAFVIDRQGRIADKLPWADPELLQQSLAKLLEAEPVPKAKAAPWTLEQRDAFARAMLAKERPREALAWLDTASDPPPSVPPTLIATALAAITRVLAMPAAEPAARAAAVATAEQAAVAAWPADPARLTAARIELAEAVAGSEAATALWQAAVAGLDPRAPDATRAWIAQRAKPPKER
jgi:hypothetical protein